MRNIFYIANDRRAHDNRICFSRKMTLSDHESKVYKADSRGSSFESAVRKCVSKVLQDLNGVEPSLTILWLFDGSAPGTEPLPHDSIMNALPASFRDSLIGGFVAPHDDGVPPLDLTHPPMRWAALHCFTAGRRIEMFHTPNDSLPSLDYKELLNADDLSFFLLTNAALQHDPLLTRLESLFPAAPKLCAALRTDLLLLRNTVVNGTVGAIVRGAPHGKLFSEVQPTDLALSIDCLSAGRGDAEVQRLGLGAVSQVQAENVLADAATLRTLFFPVRTPSKVASSPPPAAPSSSTTAPAAAPAAGEGEAGGVQTLPLFVLKWQPPLVPGMSTTFKIFEPRWGALRCAVKGSSSTSSASAACYFPIPSDYNLVSSAIHIP